VSNFLSGSFIDRDPFRSVDFLYVVPNERYRPCYFGEISASNSVID
jgi:hypothetical protein